MADIEDKISLSLSKVMFKIVTFIFSSLLSLNMWFINRLVIALDTNIAIVATHKVELAHLQEKVNSLKDSIDDLRYRRFKKKEHDASANEKL